MPKNPDFYANCPEYAAFLREQAESKARKQPICDSEPVKVIYVNDQGQRCDWKGSPLDD